MKGMIFSGPMIRAIDEGRKLVTRRPIKCIHKIVSLGTPAEWNAGKAHPNMRDYEEWGPKDAYHLFKSDYGSIFAMPGPYRPGEVVYVKETCYICRSADDGAALCDPPVVYAANGATKSDDYPFVRSAMVMPEWASRFHLRIEDVRPERAGAMTADDALLEGCEDYYWGGYDFAYQEMPASVSNFVRLWDSIYSKTFPWDSNPFVWRIAFSVDVRQLHRPLAHGGADSRVAGKEGGSVKIIRVEACMGCPFRFYSTTERWRGFVCGHDETYGKEVFLLETPAWCPLEDADREGGQDG